MIISYYAALLAVLFLFLSVYVIKGRRKFSVAIGTHQQLERRIRAHGNFIEYTPFFLILLGMAEYNGLSPMFIHLLALSFCLGRLSHAYGILHAEKMENGRLLHVHYRVFGMVCTFTTLAICSLLLLGLSTLGTL